MDYTRKVRNKLSITGRQLNFDRVSERNRLNERAIYFRFYTFLLALVQGLVHLYCDYDELALPVGAVNNSAVNSDSQGLQAGFLARVDNLLPMFTWDSQNWVRSIPQNIFLRTLAVSLSTPIVYQTFFRRWVWELALSVASLLWDVPLTPFSFLPPMYPSLIQYSFTAGLQVMFLWQSSNALFTAYVAQQPIKREQPLSSDSKDPTGTLLNGLRSKKETPKTFACWELSLITSNFPDRRKAIFTDIDRLSGPAWTQILSQCLANISSISVRIDSYLNPPAPSPPSSEEKALADRQAAAAVQSLPRISTPIQEGHVFMKPAVPSTKTKKVERGVGNLAKSYGQSTSPGTLKIPYLSPQAKSRLISSSKDLFSPNIRKFFAEQKDNHSPQGLRGTAQEYTMRFLRSKFGTPFRTTFSRRISTVVLGTPYSTLYSTITSIQSLAALAIASLDEDPYGRVSKDVPTLIRTFTRTAQDIEAFTKNLPPHWTDVEFKEDDRHVRDVETVVECLKIGLRDMVNAFGKYTKELGLQHDEMEVVRKVAGIGEEMRTVNGGI
ncbi:uncharacterized protein KY384_006884 [Bacidia gigantensis]|uniref:uncharacterized protein n=1 Tax=Bacidia gigantensis TaxID=2732470 RepID=UPI001D03817F|nr:uncharacterized protein KY384_006884 [Bacidia gigantensis]KAG8527968.1 hypothetical protein KY384_006884 [Bacidia gigantensis]